MTVNMFFERAVSPPQQRRAIERRAACIDATREIVLTDGVPAVTMHRVSVGVGGSKAAIYRYFVDSEDLIDAVVTTDRERLEARFTRSCDAVATRTEREVLREAVRAMVDLRTSRPGSVPISMTSLAQSRRRDHVARYAWCIAARVHISTDAALVNLRLARYEYIVASVDAILVGARRRTTAAEKRRLMRVCLDIVAAVLHGAEASDRR